MRARIRRRGALDPPSEMPVGRPLPGLLRHGLEAAVQRRAFRRELHADLPPVVGVARPDDQSVALHPVEVPRERGAFDPQVLRQVRAGCPSRPRSMP